MAIATINPATGETVRTFPELTEEQIDARLATAASTFATYRLTSFTKRAGCIRAAARILEDERDQVATLSSTTEMGKPVSAARQEVEKCAKACRFYAEHAEGYLADEAADAEATGAVRAYVTYQPLGPVLAVMQWEFSAVAGHALRRPGAHGRECRPAERPASNVPRNRAVPSGSLRAGRFS